MLPPDLQGELGTINFGDPCFNIIHLSTSRNLCSSVFHAQNSDVIVVDSDDLSG
jgi:hypothetical protein